MELAHASKQKISPKVGVDYRRNCVEFMEWFPDDAACVLIRVPRKTITSTTVRPLKAPAKMQRNFARRAPRVVALVRRWLMGTHQGTYEEDHLQAYLDEFSFRFNRRKFTHQGMLFFRLIEQCVAMHPMPFHVLVANPRPKQFVASPIWINKSPASLDISVPSHPWRKALP